MLKVLNDPSFIHKVTKLDIELEKYSNFEGIIEITSDDEEGIIELKWFEIFQFYLDLFWVNRFKFTDDN